MITPSSTKKGKFDLADADGNILDTNLSELEVSKRMEVYTKAAKKDGVSVEEYLIKKVKAQKLLGKEKRIANMAATFDDVNGSGKYAAHELESFADLEIEYDMIVRPSLFDEAGDVVGIGGRLNNQSLDPLGLRDRAVIAWQRNFNKLWDENRQFANSIDRHFEKIHIPKEGKPSLNKVVIDFRHMDEVGNEMKNKVIDYIYNDFPVGGVKFPSEYKQYINDKYLIKLNF